ncbi:hypothetical protein KM043_018334 [Ampulex compressa]|nr:hypothetical protein KM043_018334 [Ampulex compressa]
MENVLRSPLEDTANLKPRLGKEEVPEVSLASLDWETEEDIGFNSSRHDAIELDKAHQVVPEPTMDLE